jgi:hypothetical protein
VYSSGDLQKETSNETCDIYFCNSSPFLILASKKQTLLIHAVSHSCFIISVPVRLSIKLILRKPNLENKRRTTKIKLTCIGGSSKVYFEIALSHFHYILS